MGPETKKQAQAKLAAFRPKIGYPSKWRDYSKVEIKPDDLVGNMTARVDGRKRVSARQGRQAGRSRRVGHDAADRQRLLQPGPQRDRLPGRDPPAAVLRPGGRRRGELRRASAASSATRWATGSTIRAAATTPRASCATGGRRRTPRSSRSAPRVLVAQYSAMEALPGLHVNGELTLGENIGDLTGVAIAHRAYELSLDGKEAPAIDGITGDQRFFYGWAQAWRAQVARRRAAAAGADQSARARHDARQRPAAERRRVLQHVRRQGGRQDVAGARQARQNW